MDSSELLEQEVLRRRFPPHQVPQRLWWSAKPLFSYSYRRRTPSPPPQNNYTSHFLSTSDRDAGRARSRSRVRHRGPPPPRPTVEDEAISLLREYAPSSISSYDPPCRGVIDQYPIILESDVSESEAERLHAAPRPKESKDWDGNSERRFVLVPGTDTSSNNESANQYRNEVRQPRSRPPPRSTPCPYTPRTRS